MSPDFVVKSPANIALVKYWGQSDPAKVLPANPSFSFNLSECFTTTEFTINDSADEYLFEGIHNSKALYHIERVRDFMSKKGFNLPFVSCNSVNSFPSDCGLASSASSFSALTYGLFVLAGMAGFELSHSDLVEMTRMSGSASAVRSLGDYFVAYDPANMGQIVELGNHDLVDLVCVFNPDKKKVSSHEGHKLARSSMFWDERQDGLRKRYDLMLASLNDLDLLGPLIEEETWSFLNNHFTCELPINYLIPEVTDFLFKIKDAGFKAFYTFDAGSVVHLITNSSNIDELVEFVSGCCPSYFVNYPCEGAHLIN